YTTLFRSLSIQKAGFQYVGRLYNTVTQTTIETTTLSSEYKEILDEMDIKVASYEPVSCWNCSSPFLKKRHSACCCAVQSRPCVGNNLSELLERPLRYIRRPVSPALPAWRAYPGIPATSLTTSSKQ